MLMCDECGMWRHVYGTRVTRRLLASEKQLLEVALMVFPFLVVHHYKKPIYHNNFTRWCMSELRCESIETLYYTADYTDICIHYTQDMPSVTCYR